MSTLRINSIQTLDGSRTVDVLDLLTGDDTGTATNAQDVSFRNTNVLDYLNERVAETLPTVSDLRSYTGPSSWLLVGGYHEEVDGGGGYYYLDESSSESDNGGTIITDGSDRVWRLFNTGILSVKQFGAIGDGSNDDTASIRACLDYSSFGDTILFPKPPVNYRTTDTLFIGKKCRVIGGMSEVHCEGGNGFDILNEAAGTVLEGFVLKGERLTEDHIGLRIGGDYTCVRDVEIEGFNWGFEVWSGVWHRLEHIRLRNIRELVGQIGNIVGTVLEDVRYDTDTDSFPTPTSGGIALYGEGCNFTDLDIINAGPACMYIYTDGRESIWNFFNSCSFDTSERGVYISIIDSNFPVRGLMFDHCWFSSHSEQGIVVDGQGTIDGISFKGCYIINNDKGGAVVREAANNVEFSDCTFSSNSEEDYGAYSHILHDSVGTVSVVDCNFTTWGQDTSNSRAAIERTANSSYLIVDGCYAQSDVNDEGLILADTNGPVSVGNNYGAFNEKHRNIKQNFLAFRGDSGQTDSNGRATFPHGLGALPDFAIASMNPESGNRADVVSFNESTVTVQIRSASTGSEISNSGPWEINCIVAGYTWQ